MGGPCQVDGKSYQETDNFYTCQFTASIPGPTGPTKGPTIGDSKKGPPQLVWTSSEQMFHACKFVHSPEYVEKIRTASQIRAVCVMGNSTHIPLRADWEEVKVDMMYRANLAKFAVPELKALLLATKGEITQPHGKAGAQTHSFWCEWNPKILMRVREELRDEGDCDAARLTELVAEMEQYSIEQSQRTNTKDKDKNKGSNNKKGCVLS